MRNGPAVRPAVTAGILLGPPAKKPPVFQHCCLVYFSSIFTVVDFAAMTDSQAKSKSKPKRTYDKRHDTSILWACCNHKAFVTWKCEEGEENAAGMIAEHKRMVDAMSKMHKGDKSRTVKAPSVDETYMCVSTFCCRPIQALADGRLAALVTVAERRCRR